ncbi:MAG: class I SAM-dependent methyltransferase [Aggregatilineales bacterium]
MQPRAQSRFYDRVWTVGRVWNPRIWPEWALIEPLLADCPRRLEIGPGGRPRLPILDTWFADVSPVALGKLQGRGGKGVVTNAETLPFPDRSFDLVAACELIEHLEDDHRAFAELGRVTRVGGYLLLSVPLQPALWTAHDELAGHFRRYEPTVLIQALQANGFGIIGFCPHPLGGSEYSAFKRLGASLLTRAPKLAIWLEDRVTLPIGVRLQRSIRRILPTLPPATAAPGGAVLCRCNGEVQPKL